MAFTVQTEATVAATGVEFSAAPNVEAANGTGDKVTVTATDTGNADQFTVTFATVADAMDFATTIINYAIARAEA